MYKNIKSSQQHTSRNFSVWFQWKRTREEMKEYKSRVCERERAKHTLKYTIKMNEWVKERNKLYNFFIYTLTAVLTLDVFREEKKKLFVRNITKLSNAAACFYNINGNNNNKSNNNNDLTQQEGNQKSTIFVLIIIIVSFLFLSLFSFLVSMRMALNIYKNTK